MLRPFLVIKTYQGDYMHQLFETIDEANRAVNPSNEFPGDYICVYSLATERYVHIEHFPGGINNNITEIVEQCKLEFKNA